MKVQHVKSQYLNMLRMFKDGAFWPATIFVLASFVVASYSSAFSATADIPLPTPHPKHSERRDFATTGPGSDQFLRLAVNQTAQKPPLPTRRPKDIGKIANRAQKVVTATSAEEIAHNAKFDRLLTPLLNLEPSKEDRSNIRSAIQALKKGEPEKGLALRAKISDSAGRKLVDWYRLRSGYGTAKEHRTWLDTNPAFPNRWLISQRMEEALFTVGGPSATIKSFFKDQKPETGVGYGALASAYLFEGNKDKARQLAAYTWRELALPATLETGFLKRFGPLLTIADHKYRIDRLMLDAPRWRKQKNAKAKEIKRLIPLLPKSEQVKAYARLSVFLERKNAAGQMAKLAKDKTTDWGRLFHEVQVLRRQKKLATAAKIIKRVPLEDKTKIVNPDAWWKERRKHAYLALDQGNPKRAYEIVKVAGDLGENPLKQQAFTAGWIALRYLKDTKAGIRHMKIMKSHADGPLSRAKSAYWLGRAYEQAGNNDAAMAEYREAAKGVDTFHGQMALLKLNPKNRAIEITAPREPTADQLKQFLNNEAVRAAVIAHRAGIGRYVTRPFFAHLRKVMKSEAEVALIIHLTRALGDTQMSIRMAKGAIGSGHNVLYYSYPLHAFPPYTPLRKPPETAFLLSIARQETEFEANTVSGAGARGILQVMPITARHVCRDYRITCNIPRLLTDESYNTKIASAYIADRMGEFGGAYVLGLSGYNAGPGRTRQWIRKFGDPRNPNMDPIDWIERIPLQETRRYVTKVLSSIQVYRGRLGEKSPRRLDLDLERARRAKVSTSQ
ncbi:MAG: lytic transglycosylase domain-containing protein [Hyphomicrobiaceae bacterium]